MSSTAATLDAEPKSNGQAAATVAKSADGAVAGCPKCGNQEPWGHGSWCPKCGYYPRLGTSVAVEAEPDWNAVSTDQLPLAERLARIPYWARMLAAGMLVVFVFNLAASLCLPAKGPARAWFSLIELIAGSMVFFAAHGRAFMTAIMKDSRFAPPDFLLKPGEIWRYTFHALPGSARLIWTGAWGLTAVVCALAVVGGLRYSALVDDWGFRKRAPQSLAQKIIAITKEQAKDMSMEDALKETTNVDASDADGQNKDHDVEMLSAECVIIGYTQRPGEEEFAELILASLVNQELLYVGTVSTGISDESRKELNLRLKELRTMKPVVKCSRAGKWVQPKLTCNVSFKSWGTNHQMQQPEFKDLMSDVHAP